MMLLELQPSFCDVDHFGLSAAVLHSALVVQNNFDLRLVGLSCRFHKLGFMAALERVFMQNNTVANILLRAQ